MPAGSPSAAAGAPGKPDVGGEGAGLPEGRGCRRGGATDCRFRFRQRGAGDAVMSRFKFVGKTFSGFGAFRFPGLAHRGHRAQDVSSPAF